MLRSRLWATSLLLISVSVRALPAGYLVWSHGNQGDRTSRRCQRMTLPALDDIRVLTTGEDIECQVSYDGRWVAYAKARLPAQDYHDFDRWRVYVTSIHSTGSAAEEVLVAAEGNWPSWGADGTLYYVQQDPDDHRHSIMWSASMQPDGSVTGQQQLFSTSALFPAIPEINELFMAPDGTWFAGRTRGNSEPGVGAYNIDPPTYQRLGWAGSVGCMPYVAPDGTWGFHAGASAGIRWGHAPDVPGRQINQQLIAPRDGICYHPGISTDGQWVMTGHSSSADQNDGPWDLYIYRLHADMSVSDEQLLAGEGFNGWPHLWVGAVTPPDAGSGPRDVGGLTDPGAPQPDLTVHTDIGVVQPDRMGGVEDRTEPVDPGSVRDVVAPPDVGTVPPDAGSATTDRGPVSDPGATDRRSGESGAGIGFRTELGEGCGCGANPPPGVWSATLLLLVTGLGHRRFSRRASRGSPCRRPLARPRPHRAARRGWRGCR